jgi:hypothetical protein
MNIAVKSQTAAHKTCEQLLARRSLNSALVSPNYPAMAAFSKTE